MLSILIPVYNYDIRPLVRALQQQGEAAGVQYEIICLDDVSAPSFQALNAEIGQLARVRYQLLPQNIGRAAIRNRLAELASFDYLLFMDCDTMPETEHFIDHYVRQLKPGTVLYGGRSYQAQPPQNIDLFFHWYYGSEREVTAATTRTESPYRSFMTNNFVIPKSILLAIRFDENIKQYGHEDTLFGLELQQKNIPILHLDNPMRHIGLEKAADFLRKSEQAVENLWTLIQTRDLGKDIRLLNFYLKTKKWGLHPLISLWFRWNRKRLQQNLLGKTPSLRNFDLYKLGYMVSLSQKATSTTHK